MINKRKESSFIESGYFVRTYHANEIGNIAVLGHSGCGKTSIVEAIFYRSGLINRTSMW